MGMDLHGVDTDAYFRRNIWGWRDLADAVRTLQPTLTAGCADWFTNSGDGLGEQDSAALAERLREDVAAGRFTAWLDQHLAAKARLPRETCDLCDGTGLRTDDIGVQYGFDHFDFKFDADDYPEFTGGCNGCAGVGTRKPWAWSYSVSAPDVLEFADFLAECGGFTID